jgi:hypothetical protein
VTNLQRRFHALFYTLRGPRPQDAGFPWLLSVLTSESDSEPGKCLHQQSNLPGCINRPWLLQFFLSNYIVKLIAVFATSPRGRVTEKSHLFHNNRRSGRDRESNPSLLQSRQWHLSLSHPLQLRNCLSSCRILP